MPEEEAYFKKFDTAWKTYFDQSPDVWLKFLIPGNNTENSIKSIDSLAHAELQSLRQCPYVETIEALYKDTPQC